MLQERNRLDLLDLKRLPVRYATCDASPQARREWLMSGALTISASDVVPCYAMGLQLIQSTAQVRVCSMDVGGGGIDGGDDRWAERHRV